MSWETWSLFAVVNFGLCLTPGPAVMLVVSQGLSRGALASLWSVLGILIGNLIYFAISATSLGALLRQSQDLFFVIKWLGAAYLIWLGLAAFLGRSKTLNFRPAIDEGRPSAGRMVAHGLVLQLANPKALIYFAALLPPFIDTSRPVAIQFVILTVTSTILEFSALAMYGALAGRIALLASRPGFSTVINRSAGAILICAGLLIALMKRP